MGCRQDEAIVSHECANSIPSAMKNSFDDRPPGACQLPPRLRISVERQIGDAKDYAERAKRYVNARG